MTETPARKVRPRRTFSAFGDVRKMPSEYEIVTHAMNWTTRQNRSSAFEQNPSSAANLWFLTYRDNSPLQLARPDSGIGLAERSLWEDHDGWQPARKAIEYALISYDWGEAFTALNLVLGPTLDDVLLTQLGQVAKRNSDDLTWLLTSFLAEDSRRRGRWSRALADFAVSQRQQNRAVFAKWIRRWSALADDAALGLGTILETAPGNHGPAADVAAHARAAREQYLAGLFDAAAHNGTTQAS